MKYLVFIYGLIFWTSVCNSQVIQFIDPNFKYILVNTNCVDNNGDGFLYENADINNDKEIDKNEALLVTSIKLSAKFDSFEDINNFSKLKYINLSTVTINKVEIKGLFNLLEFGSYGNIDTLHFSNLPNLQTLSCQYSNVKKLDIINTPWLKTINCNHNDIAKLDLSNMLKLESLHCNNNNISTLNLTNCPKLSNLFLDLNPLVNISMSKLESLANFNCNSNILKDLKLKELKNLDKLLCNGNDLENLELFDLPNLTEIDCSGNNLSSIELANFPKLKVLKCNNNILTSLSLNNFQNLAQIYCQNNQLSTITLNNLPELNTLHCNDNVIFTLSLSHLEKLQNIYCQKNKLTSIFIKNELLTSFRFFFNNPDLKYICCRETLINSIKESLTNYNMINCEVNSYCSFTPGGYFYSILGESKYDLSNNGCNNHDSSLPNLKYNISNTTTSGIIVSNNTGLYFIPVQEGTHTIKPVLENPDYYSVSPDSITVTFPSTSDTIFQDFCITPKGILKQVDLSIIPLTPPARPGFDASYKVVMTNKGNQVENGTLYFSYDEEKMDFVLTDVSPSTQSDGLISWNFTNLLPFETRYYNVTLNVNSPSETPPVNAGDELLITCNILDNVFLLKQEVVGSYDPNDKTCLEGKTITPEQVGEYVHYLIRFENTGNYAAENVVVKDVIDETTFDISTLQITDASHEAWARINGNIVEFIFENIQLPFDDASNDGYICFKIKTKPTLVLGNELKNEANIYFDYNLPILTNKTNTVVANLVGTYEAIGESDIEIFPNPVSDVLKFSGYDKMLKVEIFDMSGRLVQVSSVVGGVVNVERLLSGAYQLKVYTQTGIRNGRMVKI